MIPTMEAAQHPWPALGVLLLRDGLVTKDELDSILDSQRDTRQQRITGSQLGEILVERGVVSAAQVARLVAEQYELPFMDLALADIDVHSARAFTVDQARRFSAVPINRRPDGSYDVAIADPSTVVFSDELRQMLGSVVHFVVVGNDAVTKAIADVFSRPEVLADDEEGSEGAGTVVAIHPTHGQEDMFPRSGTLAQLWPPLGALLMRDGFVSDTELEAALAQQRLSTSQRLGEILVERGVVSQAVVARLVAEQYELPFAELAELEIDASTARLLPEAVARKYRAVPIARHEDGSLEVVIADPTSVFYSDDLHTELNAPLTLFVAAPDEIDALLTRAYTAGDSDDGRETVAPEQSGSLEEIHLVADEHEADDLDSKYGDPEIGAASISEDVSDEVSASDDATPSHEDPTDAVEIPPWTAGLFDDGDTSDTEDEPRDVIEYEHRVVMDRVADAGSEPTFTTEPSEPGVDLAHTTPALSDNLSEVVQQTLATRASVLHISHRDDVVEVRARTAGVLETIGSYPDDDLQQVIDAITEDPTVRLHVLRTTRGVKVTVSAVDRPAPPASLDELGLSAKAEQALRESLEQPGVVLVSGPHGSGVTSTLYAALEALTTSDRVVATVEDHIARALDDVDQTEIDEAGDVTFATGLQQLFEMDADVILVSALPDTEAAATALRCALAGCHVLAGMSETDAASAAVRLLELAVDQERLLAALTCVVSQCLVRRVCDDCRETYYATPSELEMLGLEHRNEHRLLARGRGCRSCAGSGFRGLVAAFEVLTMTEGIRQLVRSGAVPSAIRDAAAAAGVPTLRDDVIRLCLEGLTTTAELDRVLELRAL